MSNTSERRTSQTPDSGGRVPVPLELVRWAQGQCFPEILGHDSALVDLEWWNTHLREARIPVTLVGHGPDGEMVDQGFAEISRLDLYKTARYGLPVEGSPFRWWADRPEKDGRPASRREGALPSLVPDTDEDPGHLLALLYLCAAFVSGHRFRVHRRVFAPFVRRPVAEEGPVYVPDGLGLAARIVHTPGNAFSALLRPDYWGDTTTVGCVPGLGPVVASHFLGALSSARGSRRIVPVESAAVNMLVRCGWRRFGAESTWTEARFEAFQETIHRWAFEAGTEPELVEMWLVAAWNGRRI